MVARLGDLITRKSLGGRFLDPDFVSFIFLKISAMVWFLSI